MVASTEAKFDMLLCTLVGFRQTSDLGHAEKDFDELNFRVKGANTRTRRLLGR
jgi:hypothetical protein